MRDNVVSKLLFVIGVALLVIGLITGIVIALFGFRYGLNAANGMMWSALFTYFFVGLVVGLLFIGLSEIIHLLIQLNEKLSLPEERNSPVSPTADADQQRVETDPASFHQPARGEEWEMTQADTARVRDYFRDQTILDIIPSNQEGYCLVKMMGEDGRAFLRALVVSESSIVEVADPELKKQLISWYNHTERE